MRTAGILFLLSCIASSYAAGPNVLFIAVDDLRPELACYGKSHIHSPNLDALAKRGVLFERAYCMVPTCGASRASLMTGLRPNRSRFKNYLTWAEKDAADVTTINTHFKNHGYTTAGIGKVFHHKQDSADGWSLPPWRPKTSDWHDQPAMREAIRVHAQRYPNRKKIRGMPYESFDAPDETYRDGEIATKAIEHLENFAKVDDEPFFLAVGFLKPHLPFCAPKKYWDLYDESKIQLPSNYHAPMDAPAIALHTSGELRSYASIPPNGPVSEATAKKLIHGYYACVSFTDAQVGRVVDALERLGLAENTIVVFWGDHGWQLGEHQMWNKHSCFETSMHAPLMMSVPKSTIKPNTRVQSLVEFIDIYPTLCELAAIPKPNHLQGMSLVPLLKDPQSPWKDIAVGRYKTGDTIRTDTHRYSEFRNKQGRVSERMLYDHRTDAGENTNVAARIGQQDAVETMSRELEPYIEK